MTTPPIVSITDELIAELEQLADKATGGDWEYRLGMIRIMADSDGYVPVAVAPNAPKNWRAQRDTNMQYIASVQPSVIRALLAERAKLKRDAERMREALRVGRNSMLDSGYSSTSAIIRMMWEATQS